MEQQRVMDNCMGCEREFAFTADNTHISVYVGEYRLNHVEATCPHCGAKEKAFVTPELALVLMQQHIPTTLVAWGDDRLREMRGDLDLKKKAQQKVLRLFDQSA